MRTHVIVGTAALLLLAGCSAGTGPTDPGAGGGGGDAEVPCIVGRWQLDVPDYSAQSEAYLLGLGMPIVGYSLDGSGTIAFTADGLVALENAMTVTGTIVADEHSFPINEQGAYTATGYWSPGSGDTIDLKDWATVPDPDVPFDPDAVGPPIDFTDIPSVVVECSAHDLVMHSPESPFSPLWHR